MHKGFSIIEILITLAIVAMFSAISISSYQSLNARNNLNIAVIDTVESIRNAKVMAEGGKYDSDTGVHVSNNAVTIFSGTNYSSRDASKDQIFNLPKGITSSGLSDVVFTKIIGKTSNVGDIILSNVSGSKTLTINYYGTISYNENSSAPIINYNVNITNDWGTGYCANVTITTNSVNPIVWQVQIPFTSYPINGTPSAPWNATWSFVNNILTISGVAEWNYYVSSSSPNTSVGFCANR